MSSVLLLKLFLIIEAGFTAFLVLVLIAIRPYFRSQAFFCRWMWAWTAHAASLAAGLSLIGAEWGTPLFRSFALLLSECLGMLFIPLLIAGAEAFRNSGRDARVARVGSLVALASALLLGLLSRLAGKGSLSFAIRTVPRELAASAALCFCAYVFFVRWRRTASSGSLLALLSCGGFGIARALYTLLTVAGDAPSVRWIALALFCQGGIAIATLLLILEHQAEAEATVHESAKRYRLLFERNLAGVFRSRLDGTIIDCNDSMCKLLGYSSREEIQRQGMTGLYVEAKDRAAALESLLAQGQLINHEVRMRRKDGSEILTLANVTLITEPSATDFELQGTLLDVSELRRLQEHLLQSQKLEAIGSFAGGVAHDFNNLLMVISAYCELVQEGLSDVEQQQHLQEALKACTRGADLTRQLLMFSRKRPIAQQVLNLSTVIRELSGMLRRLLDENIELQFELDENCYCRADATHVQQVLMNLAANARDAMPLGGRLRIQTSYSSLGIRQVASLTPLTPGEYIVLTVSDSGAGIDPEIRSRIFEPFFTTKELGKGTGLGLSTVYGIVKQNDGAIFVDSEPGQGSTFSIYLPRVREAAATATPALPESRPATRSTLATILLVEDEAGLRDAGAEYLRARGYRVLTAANGEEAVALVLETSATIQVLVTDVIMPGMTGPELAQVVCAVRPHLRVLYMSGYPADSPVHGNVGGTPGAYLQKPFSFHLLRSKLEELLSDTITAASD
jgi:PAS domain S-box-containing protein